MCDHVVGHVYDSFFQMSELVRMSEVEEEMKSRQIWFLKDITAFSYCPMCGREIGQIWPTKSMLAKWDRRLEKKPRYGYRIRGFENLYVAHGNQWIEIHEPYVSHYDNYGEVKFNLG